MIKGDGLPGKEQVSDKAREEAREKKKGQEGVVREAGRKEVASAPNAEQPRLMRDAHPARKPNAPNVDKP